MHQLMDLVGKARANNGLTDPLDESVNQSEMKKSIFDFKTCGSMADSGAAFDSEGMELTC